MRPIFVDILHIFVIFMMGSFVILSVTAATGEFDHWTTRYAKKRVKRPLPDHRKSKAVHKLAEEQQLKTVVKEMTGSTLQKSA